MIGWGEKGSKDNKSFWFDLASPIFALDIVQLSTRGIAAGLGEVNTQQSSGWDLEPWSLHHLLQIQSSGLWATSEFCVTP